MSEQPVHISEVLPTEFNPVKLRETLDRPFPPESIRTRKGNFGAELSYVEGHEYIRRLNEAFGVNWSFQIIQHEIHDDECIVLGKLNTYGHVRMAFGGSQITRNKETSALISIADDLKAASTDSFKKCCSFLGIGLHMYGDSTGASGTRTNQATGNGNGNGHSQPGNGNGNGNNGYSQGTGLVKAACDQSRITHADPRCLAGSVAIAAAVAYVITHEVVNKEKAINWIADLVEPVDAGFAEHVRKLNYWLANPQLAEREIPLLEQKNLSHYQILGISPFVVPSVIWSLFCAFAGLEHYESAIKAAIMLGGDVDTTAAMTGAIVGARVGAKKLPKAVKRVNDKNTWGYYRLANLANRVYQRKRKKKTVLLGLAVLLGLGDKIKNVFQK